LIKRRRNIFGTVILTMPQIPSVAGLRFFSFDFSD